MPERQEIPDAAWSVLEPMLPTSKRTGRPLADHRGVVEGVVWRFRTGAPWRDVPERFGNWNTIYCKFNDWSRDGTWARLLAAAQARADAIGELDWVTAIDSTIARVHQHGATLARDTGGSNELHDARRGAA
jgi:transposase